MSLRSGLFISTSRQRGHKGASEDHSWGSEVQAPPPWSEPGPGGHVTTSDPPCVPSALQPKTTGNTPDPEHAGFSAGSKAEYTLGGTVGCVRNNELQDLGFGGVTRESLSKGVQPFVGVSGPHMKYTNTKTDEQKERF